MCQIGGGVNLKMGGVPAPETTVKCDNIENRQLLVLLKLIFESVGLAVHAPRSKSVSLSAVRERGCDGCF